jgi:hypothetical protein
MNRLPEKAGSPERVRAVTRKPGHREPRDGPGQELDVSTDAGTLETIFTVEEIAERLKLNEDTVRRLFLNEPGVIVICSPAKGKRVYRTIRIPESVFRRVLLRFTKIA